MPDAPRIGLILLRAEWYDSVVALPELVEGVREDAAAAVSWLGEFLTVEHTWVVSSQSELAQAVEEIPGSRLDLVVLSFQVWAEDFYLLPLIRAIGAQPLAIWCYQPWAHPPRPLSFTGVLRASGPVGTLEGLGTLRNLGVEYFFTAGAPGEPELQRELLAFARAGKAWHALRHAQIGLLPARNEQMQSTFVDEFRLLADLGPQVQPLTIAELKEIADRLGAQEVEQFIQELRGSCRVEAVSDATLTQAARASLALAHLAQKHHLDVISLNDIATELHAVFGLRPCLYPQLYRQAGALPGLEGDLGAATAMLIQHAFCGGPLLFVEFWYWDEAENVIVGGHAGLQDPAAARPGTAWISQDYEYAQSDRYPGAHLQFVARPGQVTLLQVRGTPTGWQAIAASGESLGGEPWLEGYPHAAIRLDAPVKTFLQRAARVGSTQHWIMAYGDARAEIRALCSLLKIPLEEIQ